MASTPTIQFSGETARQIYACAQEAGIVPEELAEEVLAAGMATLRRLRYFEPRDPNADVSRALAILNRAGRDNPPDPGDELPEGYTPRD